MSASFEQRDYVISKAVDTRARNIFSAGADPIAPLPVLEEPHTSIDLSPDVDYDWLDDAK